MRAVLFIAVCCLAITSEAQTIFGYNPTDDTLLVSFPTEIEGQAFGVSKGEPVRIWCSRAGWDVIVFLPEEHRTMAFHYDFSNNATLLSEAEKMAVLAKFLWHEKSP